jgi:hypothetical protein
MFQSPIKISKIIFGFPLVFLPVSYRNSATPKKRINRDHAKKKNSPQIENEAIANHLEDLLIPAMAAQKSFYRQLNLRDRILTLPLMMAAILSLLWRNVAGVTELTRLLNREGFL